MSGGITGTDMDSRIEIKEGVLFKQLNLHFVAFIEVVIHAWDLFAPSVIPVITSANDGKHMDGSFHYKNLAWDLRTKNLAAGKVEEIAHMLRVNLGSDWDIVVESTHLHCEYDRRFV